jgi:hypothetical protein
MSKIKDYLNNIEKLQTAQVFVFYLAVAFAAHIDRFILGDYAVFKTHDQFDSIWPYQLALAKRVLSLQMPGWFPDLLGGMPFFIWDINWLFAPMILSSPFSGPWNLTAITLIYSVVAGFGTFLFLQYFFKTSRPAGILGGLLFALGTLNLTYWRIFELAPIPMLLFCTDRIVFAQEKKERLLLLLGIVICAASVLIAKGALFVALFQLFLILFFHRQWDKRFKVLISYGLVWVFVAIVNLPVILSLLKNTATSSRSLLEWPILNTSLMGYLENVFRFIMDPFYSSYVLIGFTGTLIVLYSLFNFKRWDRLTIQVFCYYASALFIITFIIYSDWFLSFWNSLPIAGFRLNRLIVVGPFILLVIAAVNLDSFFKFIRGSFFRVFILTLFCVILTTRKYFLAEPNPSNYIDVGIIFLFSGLFLLTVLFIQMKDLKTHTVIVLFILLFFAERVIQVNLIRPMEYHPPSFAHFFQSELFDEFRPPHKYDYRIAFINWPPPTAGVYNGYQVAGGYATYLKRYALFWASVITGESESKTFHSYVHKAYLHDETVLKESLPPKVIENITFDVDLLALHNVRYIFSLNEIEKPQQWGLSLTHAGIPPDRAPGLRRLIQVLNRITEPIPYYVYEIVRFLPRTFVASSYNLVEGQKALQNALRKADVETLSRMVVYNREDLTPSDMDLLKTLPKRAGVNDNNGHHKQVTPEITYYSDNKIVIDATDDVPQTLVLNENYFHEWTATINGRPATILPAYGAFRSVILDKGRNEVVFEFRPAYLVRAFWISGLGSFSFLAACLFWAFAGQAKSQIVNHA